MIKDKNRRKLISITNQHKSTGSKEACWIIQELILSSQTNLNEDDLKACRILVCEVIKQPDRIPKNTIDCQVELLNYNLNLGNRHLIDGTLWACEKVIRLILDPNSNLSKEQNDSLKTLVNCLRNKPDNKPKLHGCSTSCKSYLNPSCIGEYGYWNTPIDCPHMKVRI